MEVYILKFPFSNIIKITHINKMCIKPVRQTLYNIVEKLKKTN